MPKPRHKLAFTLGAILLLLSVGAGRETPSSVVGSYALELRGNVAGRGTAVVSPSFVTIQILVRDGDGNVANLVAPALPLSGGRFIGDGTMSGLPIKVSGRVDPPSEVVPVARISCVITTPDGQASRGQGAKR